jgi:hypothetical protein
MNSDTFNDLMSDLNIPNDFIDQVSTAITFFFFCIEFSGRSKLMRFTVAIILSLV